MDADPKPRPELIHANIRWTTPSWVRALAGIAALFSPVMLVAIVAQPAIGVLLALGFVALVASGFRDRRADGVAIALLADGLAIGTRDARRIVRRVDVASAFDDPQHGITSLELTNGARYDLGIADAAARERLLERVGQTLKQRALVAPLRGNLGAFTRGLLAFFAASFLVPLVVAILMAALGPGSFAWARGLVAASPLFAAIAAALVVKRIGSPRVVVGADGVRLEGRLVPRFVPYGKIARVETTAVNPNGVYGIRLALVGGGAIFLPTVAQSTAQVSALVHRIEEGRRRFGTAEAPPLELLERAGRAVETWRADVERQAKAGGFRSAPLDPHDLEELIDDAAAPLERRVGAALALRELTGDITRVRVAAECAADERVRVVLDEVAAEEVDDVRLARALESAVK